MARRVKQNVNLLGYTQLALKNNLELTAESLRDAIVRDMQDRAKVGQMVKEQSPQQWS